MNKNKLKTYLPHNFLAEKMILSCLLVNSDAIQLTIKLLPTEAFYFKNHQEIYRSIQFISKKKISIDILSFTIFLQENGFLQKIGGMQVLYELINQSPNLIYLEEYIQIVKEKFLRRSLIKFGYKIINSSYITNIPLDIILANIENELFHLITQTKIEETSTSAQILYHLFTELKEKFLEPSLPGLASGFPTLDHLTQGFQKSDLIILAGRPSTGKTALSLNIMLNIICELKIPVIFFSLEMSKEQIMYRLLSIETNINQMRLKNGKLSQNDWVKLSKIIKIISKLPFIIDDQSNLSVQDIRSKLKKLNFEQSKIGLIIVDYLQLLKNVELQITNRSQELAQITRSLKSLAREFNIPIIVLSQLNRNVDNRVDQKPTLSDLRESGSIEQDADVVLLLYQNNYLTQNKNFLNTELILAKQRNGPTGIIKLLFNNAQTKFVDLSVVKIH